MGSPFSKFDDWVTTHIIPLVYDDSMSYLEMVGAVKEKTNELIDQFAIFNGRFNQITAWVQEVKDWFNAEIARIEANMTETAIEQITPVVQANIQQIFAPFEAQVAADLADQTSQIQTIVNGMVNQNDTLRADMVVQATNAMNAVKSQLYTDVIALVTYLIANAPTGGGDTIPTNPVTNFTIVAGNATNYLSWVNPTAGDFNGVMIRRSTVEAPDIATGDLIFVGNATEFIDSALTNNTEYFYSIWALDTSANISTVVSDSATPILPNMYWNFNGAAGGGLPAELVLNKTGAATAVLDGAGGLLVNTPANASCEIVYPVPIVKGWKYRIRVKLNSIANLSLLNIIGLTGELATYPHEPVTNLLNGAIVETGTSRQWYNGPTLLHTYRTITAAIKTWAFNNGWLAQSDPWNWSQMGNGIVVGGETEYELVLETTETAFRWTMASAENEFVPQTYGLGSFQPFSQLEGFNYGVGNNYMVINGKVNAGTQFVITELEVIPNS